jgi:multiple sugar transport system ATP-binding protein
MTMAGIAAERISVIYGKRRVLREVSLEVAAGKTLVLFGPSGAGKSVLLRAIAGLEPNAQGLVRIAGADVSALRPERRGVGVAFQNFALYPHFSAFDNIASPLRAHGVAAGEIGRRVEKIAALLKIGHVLGQFPRELSNGQRQRTALARALVGEPKALLLDDPLRNVDAKLRYEMRLELPRLLRGFGAAVIYVTQDFREAMALGDEVAILAGGELLQLGAPETIYATPNNVAVARLFGDPPMNLLAVETETRGGETVAAIAGFRFRFVAPAEAAGKALLGIRPDALALVPAGTQGAAPMTILADTPLHDRHVLLVRANDGNELVVSSRVLATGDEVWVKPDVALLFAQASGLHMATAVQERAMA